MLAWRMMFAGVLLLSGAFVPAAHAAEPMGGVLDDPDSALTWSGAFEDAASLAPEACAVLVCDTFAVDVRLPAGTWDTPGGVLFAIRTPIMELLYDLDLYVYGPDGSLAASSKGFYFNDEAALVPNAPNAPNGRYRVVVVPTSVVGRLPYEGSARVQFAPQVEPVRDLLPNIVPLPPSNLHLASGLGAGSIYYTARFGNGPSSCYPSEIASGARRCLRFDQTVANDGLGPIELRYRGELDQRMRQRVYRSDGSTRDEAVGATQWHAIHGHFHYAGYAQAYLYEATEDGGRGRLLRSGRKAGFCLVDAVNPWFGRAGDSPKAYLLEDVCQLSKADDRGPYMWAGISPGWADVYPWFIADQYIEVSGIRDGTYVLELRVNLDGAIQESSYDDNAASALIRLSGDAAEVVAEESRTPFFDQSTIGHTPMG
jgi:hypothetical protein